MKPDVSNVQGISNNNIEKNLPESNSDTDYRRNIANWLSLGSYFLFYITLYLLFDI